MGIHGQHRSLVKYLLAAALCVAAQPSFATCRQALVLGLDVSGSVDDREYILQTQGLAQALTSPDVASAFLAMPDAWVDLAIFEWSGQYSQTMIQPWTTVRSEADLSQVAQRLQGHKKSLTDLTTAIGAAMRFAQDLLAQKPKCWQATFDISGDGKSNNGPRPQDVRGQMSGTIVNALVVGASPLRGVAGDDDTAALTAYFTAYVIDPDQGFIETARGFDDYQAAMERKLVKELQVIAIGALEADQ
jgi:hypothetical protein